jgi:hypothetical protein
VNRDFEADARIARDRLRSAGWTIDTDLHSTFTADIVGIDLTRDVDWRFDAHRDDRTLAFTTWRYGDRTAAVYEVHRTAVPHLNLLLVLAAGGPAVFVGWLAGCRLHRRVDRRGVPAALRGAAVVIAPHAVLPAAALLIATRYTPGLGPEPEPPTWYSMLVVGGDHPYGYVAALTILALWLALLPTYRAWQHRIGSRRP